MSNSALPLTIITHEFSPMKGGIATFVEEMASACHELRQHVEVWAPRALTPFPSRFPYSVHRVALRGTQDVTCQARMMREIWRQRRKLRESIVYLPEPGPILAMAWLRALTSFRPARLLLTFHGSEARRFVQRPVTRALVRKLITSADRLTAPSRYTRDLVQELFPAATGKTVVTNGAPRAVFFDRPAARIRTSDKVVIVTVGRLHPRKGQMSVLEALDLLPDDVAKRVEYWIVGRSVRGGYEADLRRRAENIRVKTHFFGSIDHDDLPALYARADIFAMTSVEHGPSVEGFGIAYLEASAFGLPVVGHAIGGVPEAVRHGETGLLVPPGDARALAGALQQLVLDRAMREKLGANGSAWARRHSWRDSAHALLDGIAAIPPLRSAVAGTLQTA